VSPDSEAQNDQRNTENDRVDANQPYQREQPNPGQDRQDHPEDNREHAAEAHQPLVLDLPPQRDGRKISNPRRPDLGIMATSQTIPVRAVKRPNYYLYSASEEHAKFVESYFHALR
jgi:hypothetical protein